MSDKQLDYALADVTHLIEVYQHLSAELVRENRAHWLNEEMEVLTSRETYDPHPEDAWKRLKMRLRKPQELAIVQAVAAWREREARERDVPRGRVLKDDAITRSRSRRRAMRPDLAACARRRKAGNVRRRQPPCSARSTPRWRYRRKRCLSCRRVSSRRKARMPRRNC
ncbi:hypothetical protein AJ88_06885 [Mesorhizobium amorphae CCBAU 01583]|nr:hypothetical protein AJ88_06885 [Mesorhizobium amorphae CCBAU 01583]